DMALGWPNMPRGVWHDPQCPSVRTRDAPRRQSGSRPGSGAGGAGGLNHAFHARRPARTLKGHGNALSRLASALGCTPFMKYAYSACMSSSEMPAYSGYGIAG